MRSIILYILLVFGFTANGQKIRLLEEQRLATVVTIDTDLNNFLIASGIDDDQKSGALNYFVEIVIDHK